MKKSKRHKERLAGDGRMQPTLFSRETAVQPAYEPSDINAFHFFDAAYPSPENIQNWGHLQPECVEDITDPESIRRLRLASICEVLNDDALNGMIAVGAESLIGTGCKMRVRCGLKHGQHEELEQYIEYLWDDWFHSVHYAQKLRSGQKDIMQFGSYFRRIILNPHKKMKLDVMLVSPLRILTPYNMEEGDFIYLDGERLRVYNGIAFDEFRNERFFCVSERPPFTNGYYDNAVYEWVSAKQMCHIFDPQFSEQITGYPMTAPSLEKGVMRRQYEKEELRAARLGATLTGTFKTTSDFKALFENMPMGKQQEIMKGLVDESGKDGRIAIDHFLNLPPMTEAQAFDTKHPHSGFASHRQESLKGQGRSLRMPENMATGSSANYNYASVQKDTQNWDMHRSCMRQDVEIIDLRQTFEVFLSIASLEEPMLAPILRGEINPIIPTFYWKEEEHADPVKQATANILYQRSGYLSHSDIMMKLGKDPERQKLDVKRDMDEMRDYAIYDNGVLLESLVKAMTQANSQTNSKDE